MVSVKHCLSLSLKRWSLLVLSTNFQFTNYPKDGSLTSGIQLDWEIQQCRVNPCCEHLLKRLKKIQNCSSSRQFTWCLSLLEDIFFLCILQIKNLGQEGVMELSIRLQNWLWRYILSKEPKSRVCCQLSSCWFIIIHFVAPGTILTNPGNHYIPD